MGCGIYICNKDYSIKPLEDMPSLKNIPYRKIEPLKEPLQNIETNFFQILMDENLTLISMGIPRLSGRLYQGFTALMHCAMNNLQKAYFICLPFEARMRTKGGVTSLMQLAMKNHHVIIQSLFDDRLFREFNMKDDDGKTALMYAADHGCLESFQLLFDKEYLETDSRGYDVSHYISVCDQAEIANAMTETLSQTLLGIITMKKAECFTNDVGGASELCVSKNNEIQNTQDPNSEDD